MQGGGPRKGRRPPAVCRCQNNTNALFLVLLVDPDGPDLTQISSAMNTLYPVYPRLLPSFSSLSLLTFSLHLSKLVGFFVASSPGSSSLLLGSVPFHFFSNLR